MICVGKLRAWAQSGLLWSVKYYAWLGRLIVAICHFPDVSSSKYEVTAASSVICICVRFILSQIVNFVKFYNYSGLKFWA